MPLPTINLPLWNGGNFGQITPIEVLVAYEGLITFTFRDAVGVMMLAHLFDEDDEFGRYVIAPTSARIIGRLRAGAISVRDALDQPIVWVADVREGIEISRAWAVSFHRIPPAYLPASDVMLTPRLQPMVRLRAIGDRIREGSIPASTIRNLITGAEVAYRTLRDHVRGIAGDAKSREFNVLDAQQFALNSIEIAFRPAEDLSDAEQEKVEKLFAAGIRWVQQASSALPQESDADNLAILNAVKSLSPGRGSAAKKIEISGRVLERATGSTADRVTFTKRTRRRAQSEIKRITARQPEPEIIEAEGLIKEVDATELTFELRNRVDLPDAPNVMFSFDPDDFDDVTEALREAYPVRAVGSRMPGSTPFHLIQLDPVGLAGDDENGPESIEADRDEEG